MRLFKKREWKFYKPFPKSHKKYPRSDRNVNIQTNPFNTRRYPTIGIPIQIRQRKASKSLYIDS